VPGSIPSILIYKLKSSSIKGESEYPSGLLLVLVKYCFREIHVAGYRLDFIEVFKFIYKLQCLK